MMITRVAGPAPRRGSLRLARRRRRPNPQLSRTRPAAGPSNPGPGADATASPGDYLGEVELAGRLGISRGTVREALRHLQQEGLVTAGHRGMLRVNQLSP